MLYKTIVLELIRDQPELHERLRNNRGLLAATDKYAAALKARQDYWKERLSREHPARDPRPTASEALEIAIQELRQRFAAPAAEA